MLAAFAMPSTAQAHVAACDARPAYTLCAIHHYRNRVWRIEARLGAPPSRYDWTAERKHTSAAYRLWTRHLWYTRWLHWRHVAALRPWPAWWLPQAVCVHQHEGAWNDPSAPYWGGMQMDLSFQAAYGGVFLARWGTADHWPPLDQLIAAYRGWRARGWEPWPASAWSCGL